MERRSLIGVFPRFSIEPTPYPNLPHPPQILNTTQKDPKPNQGNQTPHSQQTERDSERGERVIWMDWRGELVVRVGFGD